MKLTNRLHPVKNGEAIPPFQPTPSWHGAELIKPRHKFTLPLWQTENMERIFTTKDVLVFSDDTEMYDIRSITSGTAHSKGIR
jgi:hypothetical protein